MKDNDWKGLWLLVFGDDGGSGRDQAYPSIPAEIMKNNIFVVMVVLYSCQDFRQTIREKVLRAVECGRSDSW